jgi:hypothetical protein
MVDRRRVRHLAENEERQRWRQTAGMSMRGEQIARERQRWINKGDEKRIDRGGH